MDKRAVVDRVREYAEVVRKTFPVKKVILFGSYVNGKPRTHSDIDVAVVMEQVEDDFLMAETKLFQLRRGIDERIEPVLLEERNDRSGFLEEILRTGEIIYKADS